MERKRVKLSEINTFEELIIWLNDPSNGNLVNDPNFINKDIFSEIIKKVLDIPKINIKDILSIWRVSRTWSKPIWRVIFQKILAKYGTNLMVESYQQFNIKEIIKYWPIELENQFLVFYIFYHFYLNQNKDGIYRKLYFSKYKTFFRINLLSKKIEIGQEDEDEDYWMIFASTKPNQKQLEHLKELNLQLNEKDDEYYIKFKDLKQFILVVYNLLLKGWNFNWKLDTDMEINCQLCQASASYICGGCNETQYCGKSCQKTDWEDHQLICRPKFL